MNFAELWKQLKAHALPGCALTICLLAPDGAQAGNPVPLNEAEILAMLKARVDVDKKAPGIVVGIIAFIRWTTLAF